MRRPRTRASFPALALLAGLVLGAALAPGAEAGSYALCEGPVAACVTQHAEGDAACGTGTTEGHGANTALLAAPGAALHLRGEQWCGGAESRRDLEAGLDAGPARADLLWWGVRGNDDAYFHRGIVLTAATLAGEAAPFAWRVDRYPQPDGTKLASCTIGAELPGAAAGVPCAMNHVPVVGEVFLRPVEPPPGWGTWIPE